MVSLPVCNSWIFSHAGLLLEDWLLHPSRPVDLTNSWRQTALQTSHTDHVASIEPIPHVTLQVVVYFAFPLLPVLSLLVALANIVHEAKNYMCPQRQIACRPYSTHLSHSLMVFFVLSAITSTLIWIGCLMRYIPMSTYGGLELGTLRNPINVTNAKFGPTHGTQANQFLAQLPAILTMQAVLRLALIWITLGLIAERICVLNRLIRNPVDVRVQAYIRTIHQLYNIECTDELCAMLSSIDTANARQLVTDDSKRDHNGVNSVTSVSSRDCGYLVSRTLKQCLRHIFCVKDFELECCYDCRQSVHRWSRQHGYVAWQRKRRKQFGAARKCCCESRLKIPSETTRSVCQTFITAAFLICLSLAVCLPQLWAYQLTRNDQDISSTNELSNQRHVLLTWRLTNRTGKALYEYGLAIVSFVIPGCLLIASMILLLSKMWTAGRRLERELGRNLAKKDSHVIMAHEYLITYCVTCLNRDSLLILVLGLNYILSWLPQTTTTTVHRLNCLLNAGQDGSFDLLNRNIWPKQLGWLWIELISLFGDVLAQTMLFVIRISEPAWNAPSYTNQDESVESEEPELDPVDNDVEEEDAEQDVVEPEEIDEHACVYRIPAHSVRSPLTSRGSATPIQIKQSRILRPVRTPSDDGQTSQNISPLPMSHTLSETIHPTGQSRGSGRRYPLMSPMQIRSCRSNPSPYPSPLASRIPSRTMHGEPNSLQSHPTSLSYNEPRSSTVMLTYSPRSRHPCRSRPDPAHYQHPPTPNTPNSHCSYWPSHPSPPPLPPPPRHLTSMIGDSSIYSTPHGSPKDQTTHSVSNSKADCTTPKSHRVQFIHPSASITDDIELDNHGLIRQDETAQSCLAPNFYFEQHLHHIHDTPYSPIFS